MRLGSNPLGGSNPPVSALAEIFMETIIQNQFFILLGLFILGFGVLFWQLSETKKKLKPMFQKSDPTEELDLKQNIIRRIMRLEAKVEEMEPRLELVERIGEIAVQKVGFLRFNPFQDTGGDNSFIAVLLDRRNDGVLISSLYTREGVRLYAKHIHNGASKNHLSEEEKKVLEETINKNI